jgi:hypothetical protein
MGSPRRSSMVPRIRAYDFHDGGLDGFLVLKHGDGVEARLGDGDGAKHALVEIAELLSAESGPGCPILAALFAARVGILTVILKERFSRLKDRCTSVGNRRLGSSRTDVGILLWGGALPR